MPIKINPSLKAGDLKKAFAEKGRIQIRDFLDEKAADSLHDLVAGCRHYKFKYNEGDKEIWVKPAELTAMTDRRLREMGNKIYNTAMERKHQFSVYACDLSEENQKLYPGLAEFKGFLDFLVGKEMKNLLRTLAGAEVKSARAEALWHKPDSFETTGDGRKKGEKRVLGFSLDLSRDWDADWGGNRYFRGNGNRVEEVYTSAFNSLTLFRVPMAQSTSIITSYGRGLRLSLSGWFLAE